MKLQYCGECKHLISEEADEELKEWGIMKVYTCEKFMRMLDKFPIDGMLRLRLRNRIGIRPTTMAYSCLYHSQSQKKVQRNGKN